jgi:hypothetical protein
MSARGLRKQALTGNVYGALGLTGNGESVDGIIPRAERGEMSRLRARQLDFAVMDPAIVGSLNSQRRQKLLFQAFDWIRRLEGRLKELGVDPKGLRRDMDE